jgi:integrase
MRRFGEWTQETYGIEPKTLLANARRGGHGPEKAERVLRQYYKFLINKGNTKGSAIQWYALLRRYFTANGVDLGKYPKIDVRPRYEKPEHVLSHDNVRQMVQGCDSPRDRFLIAFLVQTGQGIGILTAMKRNMITRIASGHGIVKVPQTFPNHRGENVNELELPYTFVIGRDTMRLLHDLPLCEGGWLLDISLRQMARIVDKAAGAVRIQKKEPTDIGRSWSTVHPNTFRKYWKDCMINAGSDPRCFMHMMGNRVPSVLGSWEPTDDKLLDAYKKAEPNLSPLE